MKCSRILIAVAGSAHSYNVLRKGLAIAASMGADAQVFYVIQPPVSLISTSWTAPRMVLEERGKEIFWKARNLAKEKGVTIKTKMVEGNPAKEIIGFAERRDMDLIVIGAVGESESSRIRMGSVAGKIVRNAGRPVLVVH